MPYDNPKQAAAVHASMQRQRDKSNEAMKQRAANMAKHLKKQYQSSPNKGIAVGEPNPSGNLPRDRGGKPIGNKPITSPTIPGPKMPERPEPYPKIPRRPVGKPVLRRKPVPSAFNKKVKGFRPQFSESVREQAAERALRKRMLAAGKTHKQIQARKMKAGFLSPAEKKFNQRTRNRMLRRGLSEQEANSKLKAIKLNRGRRYPPSRIGRPIESVKPRDLKRMRDLKSYQKSQAAENISKKMSRYVKAASKKS